MQISMRVGVVQAIASSFSSPTTEEAAERHDRVSNLAANFVDHYSLHGSDLAVIFAVDRCSLDFIAADQRHSLSSVIHSGSHCHVSLSIWFVRKRHEERPSP